MQKIMDLPTAFFEKKKEAGPLLANDFLDFEQKQKQKQAKFEKKHSDKKQRYSEVHKKIVDSFNNNFKLNSQKIRILMMKKEKIEKNQRK